MPQRIDDVIVSVFKKEGRERNDADYQQAYQYPGLHGIAVVEESQWLQWAFHRASIVHWFTL
ncbi:hypothetical protein KUC_1796 [Vreelandella boliviensis LC1]|uniref:Uncharacterized protein n=1 Tax=Vreelandella boliviensis LC1 TaxID=1072583 RepID=A0A7U9GIF5_9GAMM|nr:hypothetical protein KUC_1796 [Halomonas boliviensis LC1]